MQVAVIGAGSWGTALASLLSQNQHQVKLVTRSESHAHEINISNKNERYLPHVQLPTGIEAVSNLDCTAEVELVLIAIPSHAFAQQVRALKPYIKDQGLIWATKGLTPEGQFLHEVLLASFPNQSMGILSGPSFAIELAQNLPTAVTLGTVDKAFGHKMQNVFCNEFFRCYLNKDLLGVQIGGLLKNIFAVAAGVADGLGYGANAQAALVTRGLTEMMRLGHALGAKEKTLMGLSGCGDVILSCTHNTSRNRRFGLALASGKDSEAAQKEIGQVVEAVHNVKQAYQLAKAHHVEMPIVEQMYEILVHEKPVNLAAGDLLARTVGREFLKPPRVSE